MGIPIIGDIIGAVKDLVSEAIVDPDKKREIALEIEKIEDAANDRVHKERIAQMEVNKVEAGHRSVFIAGWRPFIGWVGGVGLAVQAIVLPIVQACGGPSVEIDNGGMLTMVLGGLLGIGQISRSYDKQQGTSNDVLRPPVESVKSVQERAKAVIFGPRKEVVQALPEDAPWSK
jgi:hypothetical protein